MPTKTDFSKPPIKINACNNNGLTLLKWQKYGSGSPEGARRRPSCCKGCHLTATEHLSRPRTPPGSFCTALVVNENYEPVLSRQGSIFGLGSMVRQWEGHYCATLLWLVKWLLSGPIKPWIWSLQFRSSSFSLTSGIIFCVFTVNANAFFLALWSHELSIASGQMKDALLGAMSTPAV